MNFRIPTLRRPRKRKPSGRVFRWFKITDDGHIVIAGYVTRKRKVYP